MKPMHLIVLAVLMLGEAPTTGWTQDNARSLNLFRANYRPYSHWVAETLQKNEGQVNRSRRVSRALLLSAAVPGLGQLYNKSYWKSGLFFAVEVTSWFVYFNQTREGKRLRAEFRAFADQYWSPQRYWEAIANESGCDINDVQCLKEYERNNFSHHLPDEKNLTYYENIGKYNQFNIGWADAKAHRARDSELREKYMLMRKDSNDAFEMARLSASVVIINHIISALEAAFTAHKTNQKSYGFLRLEPQRKNGEIVPALALRITW